MDPINVQFTSSKKTAICGYFGSPQEASDFPNQGQVTADDARWTAYYSNLPVQFQANLPTPVTA